MDNEYISKLKAAIDHNWEEQIATLGDMVAIPSVAGEAVTLQPGTPDEEELPFGKEVHRVFSYALQKGHEMGFETQNVDNYGGHIEMPGEILNEEGELIGTAEETMGIVGHLDVVPAGDGWSQDPFEMTLKLPTEAGAESAEAAESPNTDAATAAADSTEAAADTAAAKSGDEPAGVLLGRGVLDDKGPVVASLYAMKAIKDAGYTPRANVRLILGLDEETAWNGMHYYLNKVKQPDFGFTPDGDFPVIHGEKGILVFQLAKKLGRTSTEGLALRSLTGGMAANMVADNARAVVLSKDRKVYEPIRDKAARWKDEGRAEISTKIIGKSLEIKVKGRPAHGSTPEKGVNAVSLLMRFLEDVSFNVDEVNDFIAFYNAHLGMETDGTSLGCSFEDEPSGKLVLNVGVAAVDQKTATLTVNIRYPVTMDGQQIYDAMRPVLNKYDIGVVKIKEQQPIYKQADDPMIRTMMDIYQAHTGDKESQPLVIGGGTYSRAFDNVVAFGACFPWTNDKMHQADEELTMADFRKMTLIFADAIYRLAVAE